MCATAVNRDDGGTLLSGPHPGGQIGSRMEPNVHPLSKELVHIPMQEYSASDTILTTFMNRWMSWFL